MKIALIRKLMAIALLGLFAQFSFAQDNMAALNEIADIVASMNHFPSDEEKVTLLAIAEMESYPESLRDMANTVANIQHFATDEGKEAMARIMANEEASDEAKSVAGVVASFLHSASDEDKAMLAALFQ